MEYGHLPIHKDRPAIGFFQMFTADDPVLSRRPWLDP